MNRSTKRVTKIDVGAPPYATDEWTSFEFNFNGFEFLPTKPGHSVKTSKVNCFGYMWWLKLYPGGRVQDGVISIFLHKSSSRNIDKGISVAHEINILDWDGERVGDVESAGEEDCSVLVDDSLIMKRCYIMDPDNNILVDGALVVELRLKLVGQKNLPCEVFIPDNDASDKMASLYYNGKEHGDVVFEFPHKSNEPDGQRRYAHYAILQACAPGLAGICEPYIERKDPIPISNVTSHVFGLLLQYIYGVKIPIADWKRHSRDLIDAADRYDVPGLKLEAEAWHVKFTAITAGNAVDLLLYADAKNCALVKESVMDYFAKNSNEALQKVPLERIPESRSLFTDLLLAMAMKNQERGVENELFRDYRVMPISGLRRELCEIGLDVDGSREVLIKRLEMEEAHDDISEVEVSTALSVVSEVSAVSSTDIPLDVPDDSSVDLSTSYVS